MILLINSFVKSARSGGAPERKSKPMRDSDPLMVFLWAGVAAAAWVLFLVWLFMRAM